MTFVKGQSGNPKGRPPAKTGLVKALRELLEEKGIDGRTNGEALARKAFEKAMDGEAWAHTLIWERIEGKVKQELEADVSTNLSALNATISFKAPDIIDAQTSAGPTLKAAPDVLDAAPVDSAGPSNEGDKSTSDNVSYVNSDEDLSQDDSKA